MKLTHRQTLELAKKIYGQQDHRYQELQQIFNSEQSEISDKISSFLVDKKNWNSKASKADKELFFDQLQSLINESKDPSDRALIKTAFGDQKSKTAGDLLLASVTLTMVSTALARKKQLVQATNFVPETILAKNYPSAKKVVDSQPPKQTVQQINRLPNRSINQIVQKTVNNSVIDQQTVQANYNTINQQTMDTIHKIRNIAEKAIKSTEANLTFKNEVEKVLTGGKKGGGQAGRASALIRTITAQLLNRQKIADFKDRNVKQYRFLALPTPNMCDECASLDGQVFYVADGQAGVNLPPMHPNCQCDIEEINDSSSYLDEDVDISKELEQLKNS